MIEITEETLAALAEYAQVSIAFDVPRVLEVRPADKSESFALAERDVAAPYVKDYDALERPLLWTRRFDMSSWGIYAAWENDARVGGVIVAPGTPGSREASIPTATLWDLRVAPDARRRGVGTLLFRAAEDWARRRGYRELIVETQNVNVAACHFYAARGCRLRSARPFVYPDFPDEIQMIWCKNLNRSQPPESFG